MGIVSVTEKMEGPRSGTINHLWQRTYVRTFTVETDSPKVGIWQVRTAPGLPSLGGFYNNGLATSDPNYEHDYGAFVQNAEVSCDSGTGGIQWTVTVNYGPYDTGLFGADPTQWKIKVQFGGDRTDRVIYFDMAGNPITNSAGDPFDPPNTIEASRSTMTVTRNELVSAFNLDLAEAYRDTINNASWNGFGKGTVKCGIIATTDPQYDSYNQVYYYTVTYPFTIDRKGWTLKLMDAGCNAYPSGAAYTYGVSRPAPIMVAGQQVSDPVPLNGAGQRLPEGGIPVQLLFDGYDEVDFTGLNLDLSTRLGA